MTSSSYLARQYHLFFHLGFAIYMGGCVFASKSKKRVDLAHAHGDVRVCARVPCACRKNSRISVGKIRSCATWPRTRRTLDSAGSRETTRISSGRWDVSREASRSSSHLASRCRWALLQAVAGSLCTRVFGGASPGGDAGDEKGCSRPPPRRPVGLGRLGFFSWDARANAERIKLLSTFTPRRMRSSAGGTSRNSVGR